MAHGNVTPVAMTKRTSVFWFTCRAFNKRIDNSLARHEMWTFGGQRWKEENVGPGVRVLLFI